MILPDREPFWAVIPGELIAGLYRLEEALKAKPVAQKKDKKK